MVSTWLHLSIGMFYLAIHPCEITHHEPITHCIPQFYMIFQSVVLYSWCCCSHINSHNNQVRGHRTGFSHSGAEKYLKKTQTNQRSFIQIARPGCWNIREIPERPLSPPPLTHLQKTASPLPSPAAPPKIYSTRIINPTRQVISPQYLSNQPCRCSNSVIPRPLLPTTRTIA